jgi:hypothetical protein
VGAAIQGEPMMRFVQRQCGRTIISSQNGSTRTLLT